MVFPMSFPVLDIVFPTKLGEKITILRQVFLPAPGYGSESVAQPANQVKRHRHHNCHQLTSIVWIALIFIANSSYEGFFLRRNLNFHHRWLTVGSECQTSQISVSFKLDKDENIFFTLLITIIIIMSSKACGAASRSGIVCKLTSALIVVVLGIFVACIADSYHKVFFYISIEFLIALLPR